MKITSPVTRVGHVAWKMTPARRADPTIESRDEKRHRRHEWNRTNLTARLTIGLARLH